MSKRNTCEGPNVGMCVWRTRPQAQRRGQVGRRAAQFEAAQRRRLRALSRAELEREQAAAATIQVRAGAGNRSTIFTGST